MKLLFPLVLIISFLSYSSTLYSQEKNIIQGTLVDAKTNEIIPYVAVGTLDYKFGTISNIEGVFKLVSDGEINQFTISHLNYETKIFDKVDKLNHQYKLTPKQNILDEVIITNTPINEIIKGYITTSKEQIHSSLILEAYYREFVESDNVYTKYSDGLLKYYIKNIKKSKADVEVLDSRAIELAKIIEEVDSTREFNMDLSSLNSIQTTFDIADLNFLNEYTNKKATLNYDYEYRSKKNDNGDEYYVIIMNPKQNIKEALNKVVIVINAKDNCIVDVEISSSNNQFTFINFLGIKLKMKTENYKVSYRKDKDFYYPYYVKKDIYLGVNIEKKRIIVDDLFRFTSDAIVNQYSTEYEELENDKKFKDHNLYDRKIKPKTNFWENTNTILLTEEQEKIITNLK